VAENPQPWTASTIASTRNNVATISNVAAAISSATGVSITSLGIATPVAREMNKQEIDYPAIFNPFRDAIVSTQWIMPFGSSVPIPAGPATNSSLMQNYAYVRANNLTNRISDPQGIYNRLANPVLNDIGPGKIQIGTAIDLLKSYMTDGRFANDQLDLAKYNGHVDQMVRDLNSFTSPTAFDLTYKLSGLMTLQAVEWYTSAKALGSTSDPDLGMARWSQYSEGQQAQLITTFYTLGAASMTKSADAQISQFGSYTPFLNSDGGIYPGSGNNLDVIQIALGMQGAIVTLPNGTTEYFDGNGKIVREESVVTVVAPITNETHDVFVIKEFGQNNNVIRERREQVSADGTQSDITHFSGSVNPIQEEKIRINADGSETRDVTSFGQDGQRTGETITTTSADGSSIRTETRNAAGVVTEIDTVIIDSSNHVVQQAFEALGADGNTTAKTEVTMNILGAGSLQAQHGSRIDFDRGTVQNWDLFNPDALEIALASIAGAPARTIYIDQDSGEISIHQDGGPSIDATAGSQVDVSDSGNYGDSALGNYGDSALNCPPAAAHTIVTSRSPSRCSATAACR
jgi:hypothetical protein